MSVNTKVNGQLVPSAGLYSVTKPIGMADIYSTEEKEVGLWIDNKPLYKKTINCGTLPNNTTKTVAHGISNIDAIVNAYGHAKATANQTPIPFVNNTSVGSQVALFADATNITLRTSEDKSPYTGYVTILYTKTTDTPWSGKFVPQGYGYVSSGDIYSFEERQVGVFADGKPLYQKTVDCGALPANTTKNVAHGITDIDRIVSVRGCAFRSASGSETGVPLPSTHYQTIGNQNEVSVNLTNVVLRNGNSSASAFDKTQVTIQYTKTTDVAGSGEYVPSGDKAVHYSENEEVIGTWFGETLYEKTIDIGTLPNSATSKTYAHGITGNIVRYDISAIDASGTVIQLPFYSTANNYNIGVYVTSTNIVVETQRDSSGYTHCYATLRYTKTS